MLLEVSEVLLEVLPDLGLSLLHGCHGTRARQPSPACACVGAREYLDHREGLGKTRPVRNPAGLKGRGCVMARVGAR